MKIVNLAFCLSFLLFLASCSGESGFDGKYEGAGGTQEFIFKSDGYVTQSLMGKKVAEYKYEKNDNEINIYINEKTFQTFSFQENGELVGPGGITLIPISINMDTPEKPSSKVSQTDIVNKPSHNITGRYYKANLNPNINPEYAPTMKLFFESDKTVKLSFRHYDTGKFRENENILSYKIDGDIITLTQDNGDLVTLTIRKDGSLFDDIGKAEYIELDE
ncbi:hypothetical protein [Colwellia demingiae]|nr:hypothetical protein [Colwellia demingiae]